MTKFANLQYTSMKMGKLNLDQQQKEVALRLEIHPNLPPHVNLLKKIPINQLGIKST